MRRRGNILFGEHGPFGIIIAVVVLGIVLFFLTSIAYGGPSGLINKFATIIPGFDFGQESVDRPAIIGYSLTEDVARYYDGTEWVDFPADGKKVKLAGFDVGGEDIAPVFYKYYRTERKGSKDISLDGDLRLYLGTIDVFCSWSKSLPISPLFGDCNIKLDGSKIDSSFLRVVLRLKREQYNKAYGTTKSFEQYYLLFSDGKSYILDAKGGKTSYKEIKEDYTDGQKQLFDFMTGWRDQILEGHPCEKFIELFDNNYRVKQVDEYLLVDLNKPAEGQEKYGEGCFGKEGEIKYVNDKGFRISFEVKTFEGASTGKYTYYWRSAGHFGWRWDYIGSDNKFILDSQVKGNFGEGLNAILEKISSEPTHGLAGVKKNIRVYILTYDGLRLIEGSEITDKCDCLTEDGILLDSKKEDFETFIIKTYQENLKEVRVE